MWIWFYNIVHHLERAEMTPQLLHDLINFSFHDLQDLLENHRMQFSGMRYSIFGFAPRFLEGLQKLVCHHFHFTHSLRIYVFYGLAIL